MKFFGQKSAKKSWLSGKNLKIEFGYVGEGKCPIVSDLFDLNPNDRKTERTCR